MELFATRLGIRKATNEWEKCVGEKRGDIQNGKYGCWQPIGRAHEAWQVLRPQVKEFLNHCGGSGSPMVMLEMYMIGRTEETAVPTILICSEDKNTRVLIRKSIKTNKLLSLYPGIGLGDASTLPCRRRIQLIMDSAQIEGFASTRYFEKFNRLPEEMGSNKLCIIGRPLIFPTTKGQRIATGGPIIYIKNEVYQLTAGHASAGVATTYPDDEVLFDDCDFDGQSDDEQSTSDSTHDSNVTDLADSDGESIVERLLNPSSTHTIAVPSFDNEEERQLSNENAESSANATPAQKAGKGLATPVFTPTSGLDGPSKDAGSLAMSTEDGDNSSLDYALIALDSTSNPSNSITYYDTRTLVTLKVKQKAQIGPMDADILAITSTGVHFGKLSSLASAIRLPGKKYFQDVYPVYLDDQVKVGHCGSAVIDRATGDFYGHIIAGTPGTNTAYIVPATDILKDITQKFQSPARLGPGSPPSLTQPSTFILPLRESKQPSQSARIAEEKRPWKFNFRAIKHSGPLVNHQNSSLGVTQKMSSSLDLLFSTLPNELRIHILTALPLSDLLNMRLVSRSFYLMISFNELPITRYHLEYHIPAYALRIYPVPATAEINLYFLCGIWSRLHVAAKLSWLICDHITKEIFLRTTVEQRLEFAPEHERMRRRLIPLLFTISHFFETYRDLHVKFIEEHGHGLNRLPYTINPIEAEIMNRYDDMTLLQCHQVFPLVMSSFFRRLRPPSYIGRVERSLRGYLKDRPPDEVYVATLCVGGLRQAERFWEIKGYNTRRNAVDDWYRALTDEPTVPSDKRRRGLLGLGRKKSQHTGAGANEEQHGSTSSLPITVAQSNRHDSDAEQQSGNSSAPGTSYTSMIFNSSLSAGMPMGPLPREQLRLIMSDMPLLQSIWLPTAEALILDRRIVERPWDIKRNSQVLLELIREDNAGLEDEWLYGRRETDSVRPPLDVIEDDLD